MMLAMVFGTSVTLSSCGDDDEPEVITPGTNSSNENGGTNSSTGLVGKWKYNFDGENGYMLMTFKADGKGTSYEYDEGDEDYETFTYVYNKSTNVLKIKWDDSKYEEDEYTLKWIDNNTFKCDIADEGSIWKRQN